MIPRRGKTLYFESTAQYNYEELFWRDISTAPKYEEILGFRDDAGVFTMIYTQPAEFLSDDEQLELEEDCIFQDNWYALGFVPEMLELDLMPTHWMPYPDGVMKDNGGENE